ncbi:MAG: TerB family tellurite resistance protein [Hyphomonadaceae bacterium]
MFIRMVLGGLLSALIVGGANGALSLYSPWNLTSLVLWFVVPAGAVILGFLGALGVGFATDLHGDRRNEAINLMLWGVIIGAAAIAINYFTIYQAMIYPTLLHHPQLSFFDFLNEYFSRFTLGDSDATMGDMGVAMGWSDFAGGAVGGFFGAAAGSTWARQGAGVKAIPKWVESAAAVMADVAHADGVLKPEETAMAIEMLKAHCKDYYDAGEGRVGDLDAFARDMTLNTIEDARASKTPLEAHFKRLSRAPEASRRLTLVGAAYVAAADGDIAAEEMAALRVIADKLDISETDLNDIISLVRARLERSPAA